MREGLLALVLLCGVLLVPSEAAALLPAGLAIEDLAFWRGCAFSAEPTDREFPAIDSAFEQQLLYTINQVRRSATTDQIPDSDGTQTQQLGCLKWSDELRDSARLTANECVFDHEAELLEDPKTYEPSDLPSNSFGETMALTRLFDNRLAGGPTLQNGAFVANMWTDRPVLIFPAVASVATHIKQVLWSTTTHVGCAVTQCYMNGIQRVAVPYNPDAPEKGELTVCHFAKRAEPWNAVNNGARVGQ